LRIERASTYLLLATGVLSRNTMQARAPSYPGGAAYARTGTREMTLDDSAWGASGKYLPISTAHCLLLITRAVQCRR
jgi:hypothetical protein